MVDLQLENMLSTFCLLQNIMKVRSQYVRSCFVYGFYIFTALSEREVMRTCCGGHQPSRMDRFLIFDAIEYLYCVVGVMHYIITIPAPEIFVKYLLCV